MKNIGIFLNLSSHGGGTYQWTNNILRTLNDYNQIHSGTQIHVFFSNLNDELNVTKEKFANFKYHEINKTKLLLMNNIRRLFITMPFIVKLLRHIYPLNKIAKKQNIDFMIFPGANFHSSLYIGKQIFMFTDIAHVFYPHFSEISRGNEVRNRNLLFKYGIMNANLILVDSSQLRLDINKYFNADISKVDVLYQTISQTLSKNINDGECISFKNQLPDKYLFYPAQLWEHKNHKNLLKAFKFIVKEDSEIFLVLSGSRKEGDEQIFSLIKELNLQNNIKYLGYVLDSFMPLLYKNAQMLVMPTYFGPTNIPTLEAFSYGCPAVISNLPGVIEQAGEAALLFDPNSPEDIADKVDKVLKNKDLRDKMIKKGYERSEILSFEHYQEKLFTILDKGC